MRFLFSAVLVMTVVLRAEAQLVCPLNNGHMVDLRAAAAKLSSTVVLSANCQGYQDNINKASDELKKLADKIVDLDDADTVSTSDTVSTDPETQERQELAVKTIENLNTLNSVFKSNKCGEEVSGFLDYADGFTDMVTGVSPFLALYGGAAAAPWVLGTTLGGAATKMMIGFFKGKDIDMRKSDQSAAFIKNSCSFYAFNQVKMSLDDLKLNQMPLLEVQLNAAKATVESYDKQSPPEPELALYHAQKASEKDKDRVLAIQSRIAGDPWEACAYISKYARGEDTPGKTGLVQRVWDLYVENVKSVGTDLAWERDYFMSQINFQLVGIPADKASCTDLATRWTNKMIIVADAGQSAAKKIIAESKDMKPYLTWYEKKQAQLSLVNNLEAKLKFFNMVTGPGFNIEYSEIIRGHQEVQDTLFRSYRFLSMIKMRGLAEAWLKVKHDDAEMGLEDFKGRKLNIDKRISKLKQLLGPGVEFNAANIQKMAEKHKETRDERKVLQISSTVDLCNQLRKAWSSWYSGLVHAEAGRDYCLAFDNVIDDMDYPDVQQMCFGIKKKHGITSMRSLVKDIKEARPQGEELLAHMKALSCRQATETTADLLKTKLE